MRIRLFSACVLSACLASLASAQPSAPSQPATTFLPPLIVPVPAPAELPAPPPSRPAVIIKAEERPARTAMPPVGPAVVIHAQEGPGPAPAPPPPTSSLAPIVPGTPLVGPPGAPVLPPAALAPPPGLAGRYWFDNDALLWAIQGTHLPPLVSTSPPGTAAATAGVLGTPGATSIYGPGSQNNDLRFGYRTTFGAWLDDAARFALEAQFLMTANGGNQFNAYSPGTPILARPVINAATGAEAAEPIAVPGVASGMIHVATTTTGLTGAGIWLRENFTRTDDPCDSCHLCRRSGGCCGPNCGAGCDPGSRWYCRVDSLFGYRYLHLSDNLEIDDQVNAVAALNGVPAGGTLQRTDIFHASNTFHGIDLGMVADMLCGPWTITGIAKVAVGFNDSSVDITGYKSVGGVTTLGGLLAQTTNIGHYSHTMASAVPELDLRLAYSFSPTVKVYCGYTFLYWYHVARSADQINPSINPAFLTSSTAVSTVRQPLPLFEDRSIWIQGLSVGLEWRY
jgi:hypothetical protein